MLAWYYLLHGDPLRALPHAQISAGATPESATAQLVLGRALVESGSVSDGLLHLEGALKLDPSNLEVHLALVKAYSESGRKEEASRERRLCVDMTKEALPAAEHP